MTTASDIRRAAGVVVGAHKAKDPDRIRAARAELATRRIELFAERVVAEAPPLSAEQRERIADILRSGGSA